MSFLQGPKGAFSPAHPVASPAGSVQIGKAAQAALGNTQNSLTDKCRHEGYLSRYMSRRTAAFLMKNHDDKLGRRLADCGRVARDFDVNLERHVVRGEARVNGVKTCLSVWCCPTCSARITNKRRDELNDMLAAARAENLAVVMLTLTFAHTREMVLSETLTAFKRASDRLRQRAEWRRLKPFMVGTVSALEVTHGRNGWHPHGHWLIVMNTEQAEAQRLVEKLREAWLVSLESAGLSGGQAAFHVQGAQAAGSYIGKFGAAEELALSGAKVGRKGSRSPWQILADARDGDRASGALFVEYALAFRGRRQLIWSNGFKARMGIEEVADNEIGQGEDEPQEYEVVRSWHGSSDRWRNARARTVAMRVAVERQTSIDAAEFGPTDVQIWRISAHGPIIENC